jgi:hypothetical protein
MKIVKETLENFINSKNMLYYLFEYLDNWMYLEQEFSIHHF